MEDKARESMVHAEKRLNSWGWGGSAKYEDAADLFTKAGNLYKTVKKYDLASCAYARAAECQLKLQSPYEAATLYVTASKCIKKEDAPQALQYMQAAIEFYTNGGSLSQVATLHKEIAEIYETTLHDPHNALLHYQLVADYYEGEGSTERLNTCLCKIATMMTSPSYSAAGEDHIDNGGQQQQQQYDKAIKIYEQVAMSSVDHPISKWSAKESFLRAGLCHLATNDMVASRRAIERYQDIDVTFSNTRECKLLLKALVACENMDEEAFKGGVVEYDGVCSMDPWKVSILLKIKEQSCTEQL
eukprot:TRINITY_DN322_c1_g1_i5.p1 TRINITY_DN322_c1_g1~~TRINITY_DN322_c1_g1_i5.p1  ORF type:complete len:301 (-),score=74.19 TRINITY_DN322_c1_g1_i5:46-948(-)